jgi:hypothetical protein
VDGTLAESLDMDSLFTLRSIRLLTTLISQHLSAFSLQIHCTEITAIYSQIADDVCDKAYPRFERKKHTHGRLRARLPGRTLRRESGIRPLAEHPRLSSESIAEAAAPIHSVRDLSAVARPHSVFRDLSA